MTAAAPGGRELGDGLPGLPTVGLRETCRVVEGAFPEAVPLWPWHRARLRAGGCDEDLLVLVESKADAAVSAYEGRYGPRVRLSIAVDPTGLVLATCERRLSSLDVPGGPTLGLVTPAVLPGPAPGPAKPLDRSAWDAALRVARDAGADQGVLVGTGGEIADGTTANLWAVSAGVLHTPAAPPAIPGVARAWLLAQAVDLGLEVRVGPFAASDLRLADELFLTNALAGAVAVRGRGGPVTARVIAAFTDLWRRPAGG